VFHTALLAAALAAPAAAAAADPSADGPLTWKWSGGEPYRFVSEMLLDSPTVIWFFGRENAQARMFRIELAAQYVCTGEPVRKDVKLTCKVEDARMGGAAVSADQDQVAEILREYERKLKEATVEVIVRSDGHIKLVDLEGVSKDLLRENEIQEILRQIVRRSLAPLGMQAPRGGADPGRAWRHKGPPAFFELFSKYGSSGGMLYEYTWKGESDGMIAVTAAGRATVATTQQREAGLPASLGLDGTGAYRFDGAAGELAYAEVAVSGETTASYSLPGSTQGFGYGARVMRVNADGSVEGPDGPVK
jgi:hypothetical protein